MDFGANKTPIEIIKEGAFGGTYFGDIYVGVNNQWYKKSWKKFDQLNYIDQKYYCSSYCVNKQVISVEHCEDFWKIMDGLMKQMLMVGFSGIFDNGQAEDQKMMRNKIIDRKGL